MKIPRKKKEDDVFKSTKKEIKAEKKIPFALRQEIRQRAKTQAGGHGREAGQATKAGTLLRKTFTPSKTGVKPVGEGHKLTRPKKPIITPPSKQEEVGVIATTFDEKGNVKGRSKPYMVKNRKELEEKTTEAQKEAGFKKPEKTNTDVGNTEFSRNQQSQSGQSTSAPASNYEKGSRTAESDEKIRQDRLIRAKFIRDANGKIGKGERKAKKYFKKQMKDDARKGKYK